MRLLKYLNENYTILTLERKGSSWILTDGDNTILKTTDEKDIISRLEGYVSQLPQKIIDIVKKVGSFSFTVSKDFSIK